MVKLITIFVPFINTDSRSNMENLLQQYIGLINFIKNNRPTLKEIQNDPDIKKLYKRVIPIKTFQNHKNEIEKLFGIEIKCDKSENVYYIPSKDKQAFESNDIQEWLFDTLSLKVLISDSYSIHNRILVEEVPSGQEYLAQIIQAMKNNHKIKLDYLPLVGEIKTIIIEPWFLKLFKQRWYVIGKSTGERVYSLTRIKALEETTDKFKLPNNFNPDEYCMHIYGVTLFDQTVLSTVRIKVIGIQRVFLRELPIHHSQKESIINDNESVFEYYLKPTIEFKMQFLSYGKSIEVLEPKALREEFAETIKELNQKYN
ncbi:MAG: WYL domain-containing protein [Paludibacter sp.]